jgi:hypothetical protein
MPILEKSHSLGACLLQTEPQSPIESRLSQRGAKRSYQRPQPTGAAEVGLVPLAKGDEARRGRRG